MFWSDCVRNIFAVSFPTEKNHMPLSYLMNYLLMTFL